ncbi:MAG: N-acetylmuramoyl-L-alanine amidase [Clostridia bacterium]|nr:N-acetylmuramoyl-L-alanine amidase [Clostridia bacterium]
MSNSPLVVCTKLSPNNSGRRNHTIDRITPHCVVGQCSASALGDWFSHSSTGASSNYGIGCDGEIGMYVEEANRSWCSSDYYNDHRSVCIECASDSYHPYKFNDNVYESLIELCADICKRNGKKKLLWIADKSTALNYSLKSDEMLLTVHRWFDSKSCPGDWMYSRMGDLAEKVTKKLGGSVTPTPAPSVTKYPATPFTVQVLIDDLNFRSTPNGIINGQTGKGIFTITEVKDGWGKLKSGKGWIYLANPEYTKTLSTVVSKPATKTYKQGDVIRLKSGSRYTTGARIPDWVLNSTLYYRGENSLGVIFSTLKTGDITGVTAKSNII